jgi:hypothetical protein
LKHDLVLPHHSELVAGDAFDRRGIVAQSAHLDTQPANVSAQLLVLGAYVGKLSL